MKASVIICTFNRARLLVDTLQAIINQHPPDGGYEIVVVDNNSSDETRLVAEQAAARVPVCVRYVFEADQGLSLARNAGIRAAKGEIVAFVDDDVDAGPHWLRTILVPFSDQRVACVGGPIRPIWLDVRPPWLTKDWEG